MLDGFDFMFDLLVKRPVGRPRTRTAAGPTSPGTPNQFKRRGRPSKAQGQNQPKTTQATKSSEALDPINNNNIYKEPEILDDMDKVEDILKNMPAINMKDPLTEKELKS